MTPVGGLTEKIAQWGAVIFKTEDHSCIFGQGVGSQEKNTKFFSSFLASLRI
jgi:hypothetical protein